MLDFFKNKKFLFLLAIINFAIGLYSISYYFPQLRRTNPLLWLFVIDCPLYAILFGVILILRLKKISFPLLDFIVIVGMIKYALWTFFVLIIMGNFFSHYHLTIGHFLLIIQVIIFYKYSFFKKKHLFLGIGWFLLNDFFDYVLLTHPYFDNTYFLEVMFFSVAITIIISFFVFFIFKKKPSTRHKKES